MQSTTTAAKNTSAATLAAIMQGGGNFTDDPGLADADSNAPVAPLQMINAESLLDVPGFVRRRTGWQAVSTAIPASGPSGAPNETSHHRHLGRVLERGVPSAKKPS